MQLKEIKLIYKKLTEFTKNWQIPVEKFIEDNNSNPLQILIIIILSARTNDKTTVKVTETLFKQIITTKDIEKIKIEDLEKQLFTIGFYKNKAKFIKKLPTALKAFNNKIPDTIENLIKLPGVGRKTANLFISRVHKKPAICVDVHVHRITNRIGIIETKTTEETEFTLKEILPKNMWSITNHIFVKHGQNNCHPRNPECNKCPLTRHCKYYKEIFRKSK
jgi:endonuclease III